MAAEFLKRAVDISFPVLRGIEKSGATAVVPVRFCFLVRKSCHWCINPQSVNAAENGTQQ
jgi:hypothetical protein